MTEHFFRAQRDVLADLADAGPGAPFDPAASNSRPGSEPRPVHGPPAIVTAMYRTIVMFPKSADQTRVDQCVTDMAAAFKQSPGFRSMTASVGALMGPGAQSGDIGQVVEADFESLDDFMAALNGEVLARVNEDVETVGATLLLFENVTQ